MELDTSEPVAGTVTSTGEAVSTPAPSPETSAARIAPPEEE